MAGKGVLSDALTIREIRGIVEFIFSYPDIASGNLIALAHNT